MTNIYQFFQPCEDDGGNPGILYDLNKTREEVIKYLCRMFYDLVAESTLVEFKLKNNQSITIEDIKEIILNLYYTSPNDDYDGIDFLAFKCIDNKLIEVPLEDLIDELCNEMLNNLNRTIFPVTKNNN